jgi:DNA helicase II / ATP-dependent DNA helicase PcrA
VETVVVNAEMVSHLMNHGDQHLVHDLVLGGAQFQDGTAEHGDAVRQHHVVPGIAISEGHALVQTEQAPRGGTFGHHHHHVVHQSGEIIGDGVEGIGHQFLEPFGRHLHRPHATGALPSPVPADRRSLTSSHAADAATTSHPEVSEAAGKVADVDHVRLVADLDDLQRRAVTTSAMPLRILAGAGSGKTRVLTRRIAYRVATATADPRHVLALTFTRKAAGELQHRLRHLGLRDDLAAGTFHAMAYAQLRTLWADRNQKPWTLLDRKVPLVAELLPRQARSRTAALDVVSEIEWAKARMIGPGEYVAAATAADRRPGVDATTVTEVFVRFEEAKRSRRLLDFDDLLDGWRRAIERGDDFAQAQRWRFRHLFVDEFQDVNPLQYAVLAALLGESSDLCVVGDPRQAIYAWNGADARYLVDFERWWPKGATVELIDNYRSTPQVLDLASAVLAPPVLSGRRRAPAPESSITGGASTQLRAHRADGALPTMTSLPTDAAEAAAIARRVRDRHRPGARWGRQAVLVRTNAQTALLEQALRAAGVPFRVRGGGGLLTQPEVKAALRDLRRSRAPFATAVVDLGAMIAELRGPTSDDDQGQLAGTEGAAGDTAPDPARAGADDRAANLETLQRLAQDFAALVPDPTVSAFEAWLTTSTGGDEFGTADAVEITTFHAAKGLEWSVVHLAGLEDGLVPIGHARSAVDQAEERRLFYVAVTRAEEELHCSWAEERTFGTRTSNRRRSPFLDEAEAAGAFGGAPANSTLTKGGSTAGSPADRLAERRARRRLQAAGDESGVASRLRAWRSTQAKAARTPAYTVFNDETLDDLVSRRPASLDELLEVRGIGPVKARRFGEDILAIIADSD